MSESFEAIAKARKIGAIGIFETKWLTVPTDDIGEAFAAFRKLGFECQSMRILTQEQASKESSR